MLHIGGKGLAKKSRITWLGEGGYSAESTQH